MVGKQKKADIEKLTKPQLKKSKEAESAESPLEKLKKLENGKAIFKGFFLQNFNLKIYRTILSSFLIPWLLYA